MILDCMEKKDFFLGILLLIGKIMLFHALYGHERRLNQKPAVVSGGSMHSLYRVCQRVTVSSTASGRVRKRVGTERAFFG